MLKQMQRKTGVGRARGARFAWITDAAVGPPNSTCEREILRTERFVALPSLGALVPGWTLLVPRRPILSLAETTSQERVELAQLADTIAKRVRTEDNQVFCFEHGSREVGSATGCGVDQAHLHVVPLPFDLIAAAFACIDGAIAWSNPVRAQRPLDLLPVVGEYVAIWRVADRLTMIGNVRRPVSQWVRRVIAANLGIGEEWNYRTHPQAHNVNLTLMMLAETP